MTVLLVFPLDMDAAVDFIAVARALGSTVVGASSVIAGPGDRAVDHFEYLPYVTAPEFPDRLAALLARHGVGHVYAPHHGVWWQFDKLRRQDPARFGYTLCQPDPFTQEWRRYAASYAWAEATAADPLAEAIAGRSDSAVRPPLAPTSYAGMHVQFSQTPGQCDEAKLAALAAVARLAPAGDVVEIGSLYGRSAVALAWLAREHDLGGVVCVDPWRAAEITDQGAQAALLTEEMPSIDVERIFQVFRAVAAAHPNLAYLRATSTRGRTLYAECAARGHVEGQGRVPVTGAIALLHIDGNHRYDHVKNDIGLWAGLVRPDGWILVDDYLWAFGDGPRRAGDELLAEGDFDHAFVVADTLFLRRRTLREKEPT